MGVSIYSFIFVTKQKRGCMKDKDLSSDIPALLCGRTYHGVWCGHICREDSKMELCVSDAGNSSLGFPYIG